MSGEVYLPNSDTKDKRIAIPGLYDILKDLKRETMADLNCCMIGTIQSFNAGEQSAKVKLAFKRIVEGAIGGQIKEYPVLVDCPVVVLGGGAGNLTFPIAAGDTCVVLFCDRDIDVWFSTGQEAQPNSERLHDLSDGIAIVGIRSLLNPIAGYNTNGVQLFHGDAQAFLQNGAFATLQLGEGIVVTLTPTGVMITSGDAQITVQNKISITAGGVSLKTALDALCTVLTGWVDTDGETPDEATILAINAVKLMFGQVLS